MKPKKLAVFVEGQTEQIFLREFIEQIGGQGNMHFECRSARNLVQLVQNVAVHDELHSVLIYDCGGDEVVKSTILDQRDSLTSAEYSMILGLRDLYPSPIANLHNVRKRLRYGVPTGGVPTHILLAVSEIEAWFLQDHSHFKRIDSRLNPTDFEAQFGFNPFSQSAEDIHAPAALLHSIYGSVGKAYKKTRGHVQRTVDVIDYEHLYIACAEKLPHLVEFVTHLENYLVPDFA